MAKEVGETAEYEVEQVMHWCEATWPRGKVVKRLLTGNYSREP